MFQSLHLIFGGLGLASPAPVRDDGRMKKPDDPDTGGGVLAGLPTTRPQRRSPKRTPRSAASTPSVRAAARRPSRAAEPSRARRPAAGGPSSAPAAGPSRPEPPPVAVAAAAQGFEAGTAHGTVAPPTRADLVGSVVHGAGDIVHVGLDVGRLLLRSVLRRLPG